MIIIMPTQYRGLLFFLSAATTQLDQPLQPFLDDDFIDDKNILNEAIAALEKNKSVMQKLHINMPRFTVDTNTDVQKHLRKVILPL